MENGKHSETERRVQSAELAAAEKLYNPYGRAGGGAPKRATDGMGKMKMERC